MLVTKHHGLGNDFLIVLANQQCPIPSIAELPELARAMCDRRLGMGADGLIVGYPCEGADLQMVLHNADGSRAEMSGNGIRCLAQAEVMRRGRISDLRIDTDGGMRDVRVEASEPGIVQASVDMGAMGQGPGVVPEILEDSRVVRAATGDLGNPHLVVQADLETIDVAEDGAGFESHYAAGLNVEFISARPDASDSLDLVVWERGAGVTAACGTGAVAAAVRANEWGLVGSKVAVHMPGGRAVVEIGERATLTGPSQFIAAITWGEEPDWGTNE